MEELGDVRMQKAEELKRRLAEQQASQARVQEAEQQLDGILSRILSVEAKQRLSNVKLVNQNLYFLAARNLIAMAKSRGLAGKLSDDGVKALLKKLSNTKREIRIKRK